MVKNILVTGGAGYVGSHLVRVLLQNNFRVTVLDNLMWGGDSLIAVWHDPNFCFVNADITNTEAVSDIFNQNDFDAVIHLAAIVGDPACSREPELARKINWDASCALLEIAIEKKVERFIFASTCSNYGKMPDPDSYVDENSELAPVSLYAELKVKFENKILNEITKTDDFCPTSLRFSTVYGISPRMRFDLTVNEFTKELACEKELLIFGEQFWRPYCHVTDFASAMLVVLEASKDKVAYNVFNVGDTKENYTKGMIVNELEKQFPDAKVKRIVKEEDPRDYRVSFTKINSELGFKISKTVPEGIHEIKEIIEKGVIQDPENQKFYNIPHKSN